MTDKAAAQAVLARMIRDAERRAAGLSLVDPDLTRAPIGEHIAAWCDSLETAGCVPAHVSRSRRIIERLTKECGWRTLPDMTPQAIDAALVSLRRRVSAKTANNTRGCLASLFAYCIRTNRLEQSPLKTPPFSGHAIDRRALTTAEIRTLLTCRDIPQSRRDLYAVAILTGLRAGELRGLLVSHCHAGPGPHLDLPPTLTKSGKRESVPLCNQVAMTIAEIVRNRGPFARVFNLPDESFTSRRFQKDLSLAGVPIKDHRGHIAVFHSLRKTYNTLLAASGVSGTMRMQLMRQRTVDLAETTYLDPSMLPVAAAVEAMPLLNA